MSYTCDTCGQSFNNEDAKNRHMNTAHAGTEHGSTAGD